MKWSVIGCSNRVLGCWCLVVGLLMLVFLVLLALFGTTHNNHHDTWDKEEPNAEHIDGKHT